MSTLDLSPSYVEVECKYRLTKSDDYYTSALDLRNGVNGVFKGWDNESHEDTFYDTDDHALQAQGKTLRLRQFLTQGQGQELTAKGPRLGSVSGAKARVEYTSKITRGQTNKILSLLNYTPTFTYFKKRRSCKVWFEGEAVNVSLDGIEGLGRFMELELMVLEGEQAEAGAKLKRLAATLGLSESELELRSYSELVKEKQNDQA